MEQVRSIDGEIMVLCVNVQLSMFNAYIIVLGNVQYNMETWSESCTYRHVIQRISYQS
jgi:hypothetical protein